MKNLTFIVSKDYSKNPDEAWDLVRNKFKDKDYVIYRYGEKTRYDRNRTLLQHDYNFYFSVTEGFIDREGAK